MTLLTTLIPAYKPDYLEETFLGLATQTHTDFRVIVSDDSPGGAVTELIRSGRLDPLIGRLNMTVIQGPRKGSMNNIRHGIAQWGESTPLLHVQLDDDVIYPDFYREHLRAHAAAATGASVSLRWITRTDGRPGATLPVPAFIDQAAQRTVLVPAQALFQSTVPQCENWMGELTNVVLSVAGARKLAASEMAGWSYYGLGDIGVLLDIARDTPVAFIRDHLSGFRQSPQQTSANTASVPLRCGFLAWIALALAAWSEQRVTDEQVLHAMATTLERCHRVYGKDPSMKDFYLLVSRYTDLPRFRDDFAAYWSALLTSDHSSGVKAGGGAPGAQQHAQQQPHIAFA